MTVHDLRAPESVDTSVWLGSAETDSVSKDSSLEGVPPGVDGSISDSFDHVSEDSVSSVVTVGPSKGCESSWFGSSLLGCVRVDWMSRIA